MISLISFLVGSAEGEPLTYETHHWLLPETAEIIYGGLASVLVISALVKFAGPMIKLAPSAFKATLTTHVILARTPKLKRHEFVPHLATSTQSVRAFLLKPILRLLQSSLKGALVLPQKWLTSKQRQCQTLQMLQVVLVMNFALKFLACPQLPLSALLQAQ
jgi:hypothetical protein